MTLQTTALLWWCVMYRRLNRYVWWCVLVGMLLILLHCAGYFTHSLLLSQVTAMSNSILVLFAVITTWRSLRAHAEERKAFEEKLAQKTSLAAEIAKILNQHRREIEYYEAEAKKHGIPPYPK